EEGPRLVRHEVAPRERLAVRLGGVELEAPVPPAGERLAETERLAERVGDRLALLEEPRSGAAPPRPRQDDPRERLAGATRLLARVDEPHLEVLGLAPREREVVARPLLVPLQPPREHEPPERRPVHVLPLEAGEPPPGARAGAGDEVRGGGRDRGIAVRGHEQARLLGVLPRGV